CIDVVGRNSVHCVAYFGDVTGNGGYSALDASFIDRVAAGLDTGFEAFPVTDPHIMGDINEDGKFTLADAFNVANQSVGVAQPQIPPLPAMPPPLTPGSVDPTVTVTSTTVLKGSDFTDPLTIDTTPGLQAFDLNISFNPAAVSGGSSTVQLGSLL